MQLPISMPGLGHVNCYALADSRGLTLVDPGLPGPDSWAALSQRLRSAGLKLGAVHTVTATHTPPAHSGGAGHPALEPGAEVVAPSPFARGLPADPTAGPDIVDVDVEDLPG